MVDNADNPKSLAVGGVRSVLCKMICPLGLEHRCVSDGLDCADCACFDCSASVCGKRPEGWDEPYNDTV